MYILKRSGRKNKAFAISGPDLARPIHFGTRSSYVFTQDPADKKRFDALSTGLEDDDKTKAFFWTKWLLYNSADLDYNIQDLQRRFGIRVVY